MADINDKKRLTITLDFTRSDEEEVELFLSLKKFSNPQGIIKDILKGTLSVEILKMIQ